MRKKALVKAVICYRLWKECCVVRERDWSAQRNLKTKSQSIHPSNINVTWWNNQSVNSFPIKSIQSKWKTEGFTVNLQNYSCLFEMMLILKITQRSDNQITSKHRNQITNVLILWTIRSDEHWIPVFMILNISYIYIALFISILLKWLNLYLLSLLQNSFIYTFAKYFVLTCWEEME